MAFLVFYYNTCILLGFGESVLRKSLNLTNIKCCKLAVWIKIKNNADQIRSDFLFSCTVAKSNIVHLCCWERLHSRHAIYRLFKPGSGFCLSLVPSGLMRVSARTDHTLWSSEISVRSLASRQGALASKNVTNYVFQSTMMMKGRCFQLVSSGSYCICTMCVCTFFSSMFQPNSTHTSIKQKQNLIRLLLL